MQKYHDEPKQYKGYLKSALTTRRGDDLGAGGPAAQRLRATYRELTRGGT